MRGDGGALLLLLLLLLLAMMIPPLSRSQHSWLARSHAHRLIGWPSGHEHVGLSRLNANGMRVGRKVRLVGRENE